MLGKNDPFEVVFDPARDPGADKRGLFWSGQVFPAGKTPEERAPRPARETNPAKALA